MARRQLTELLEARGTQDEPVKVGEAPTAVIAPPDPEPPLEPAIERTQATALENDEKRTTRPRRPAGSPVKISNAPARPKTEEVPPYLRFERKEARLRADQVTQLNVKARELNKSKDQYADRITDNTLIRIAVDLILSRANDLRGGDETQLRKSLGL